MNGRFTSQDFELTREQQALVERPIIGEHLFLEGPAGVGKTTVGTARLRRLLVAGIPAHEILVLTPQRTLLTPYMATLYDPGLPPGGLVDTLTIGGLARRMVDLFWPLIAERAGFAYPDRAPTFLTLETAQYYMARVADPLIDQGAFDGISIERNRLLSQILDNLNKAALVGMDYAQVGERLQLAWTGSSARATVYERAQACANAFRAFCLAHNLLDFSLQVEVFVNHLLKLTWPSGEGFMRRFTRYRHLIVDNLEEDTPITHDLLYDWIPGCDSVVLIYDQDAGYRVFLGADPDGGLRLREVCRDHAVLDSTFVSSAHLRRLGYELARSLHQTPAPLDQLDGDLLRSIVFNTKALRFHTQMLDWITDEIVDLVDEGGVSPSEIVVVAPFMSDALRFSLSDRLSQRGVPTRTHRPSRALRDEPAARCLLTLAALAFPEWQTCPSAIDVTQALALAIGPLDVVRSQLLTSIVFRPQTARNQSPGSADDADEPKPASPLLNPFSDLKPTVQERIGYRAGNLYDDLREWLYRDAATAERSFAPVDHFFSQFFGEVLSQPGYGFHGDMNAGRIAAQLIESARKFRQAANQQPATASSGNGPGVPATAPIGLEYIRMVERGVIAAQYIPAWETGAEDAVLLAPAYTFLMHNRPVDYQIWLSVGSSGWWERLYQPLTHPYVLTRRWRHGDRWTDAHEVEHQTRAMHRLVQGLIRRCRVQIFLGVSSLGEQGYEQRGRLLNAFQSALRRRGLEQNQREI